MPSAEYVRQAETTPALRAAAQKLGADRKSTRLNSSHLVISYAVFCLKKTTTSMPPATSPSRSTSTSSSPSCGQIARAHVCPLSVHDVLPYCDRTCSSST